MKKLIEIPENATDLGVDIITLRNQGMTYNQIVDRLGCSKSTVNYWVGNKGKENAAKRGKNKRFDPLLKFKKAVYAFRSRKHKLREDISSEDYSYQDVIDHLGGIDTTCYLTGEEINLETGDFNLDHIIPISKDGTNNLDNLGVTSARLNMVKSDLLVEELLEVCKDILTFNGYEVIKKQT